MDSLFHHLISFLPLVRWSNKNNTSIVFSTLTKKFTAIKMEENQARISFLYCGLSLFFLLRLEQLLALLWVLRVLNSFNLLSLKRAVLNPWLSAQESDVWRKKLEKVHYYSYTIHEKLKFSWLNCNWETYKTEALESRLIF